MSTPDTISLHQDIMFRSIGEEGILVDQRKPEVIVVNSQALRIIELIRETGSRNAVCESLAVEYEAPRENIEKDVDLFLQELREKDLIA